jgi:hypothetical protein
LFVGPGDQEGPVHRLAVGTEVGHVPPVVEHRPEGVVEREAGISRDRSRVLPGDLDDLAALLAPEVDTLGREDLVARGETGAELDVRVL